MDEASLTLAAIANLITRKLIIVPNYNVSHHFCATKIWSYTVCTEHRSTCVTNTVHVHEHSMQLCYICRLTYKKWLNGTASTWTSHCQ